MEARWRHGDLAAREPPSKKKKVEVGSAPIALKMKMLKEFVKERLQMAADDISRLFERTILSYEKELSPTREQKERHRQLEVVDKIPLVFHFEDIQQSSCHGEKCHPQLQGWGTTLKQKDVQLPYIKEEEKEPLHLKEKEEETESPHTIKEEEPQSTHTKVKKTPPPIKEEEEEPLPPYIKEEQELWLTREEECLLGLEEPDLTKFSTSKTSCNHREDMSGAEPPRHMTSEADGDHYGQLPYIKEEEKEPLHLIEKEVETKSPHTIKEEEPQSTHTKVKKTPCPHIKEEEEEPLPPFIKEEQEKLCLTQEEECLLGLEEADLTKFSTSKTSCNHREDMSGAEPPQHMTSEADGDHCGGSKAENILAPLSDCDGPISHSFEDENGDGTQEALSSNTDGESDKKTRTDKEHSECSKKTKGTPFSCLVCGQIFPDKTQVKRHMRTHTGENPSSCSVCGKGFSEKKHARRHMKTHTGEKHFRCSVCFKSFNQKHYLQSHMRTHTGEKPFSCSVCGKGFPEKINVPRHMKTHTGEKPFKCSVCFKSFIQKHHLQSHMRTHTGENPFSCSVCGKGFPEKINVQRHMKTHTG
ncbi:gastrula zinc finger protein xFG20-1-like [Entelurus aequoreus]|uniref:gastrula zinc finger protein xFG20-1-like n=1 Tax=Entelurus aequoreus TaxID=161455 RepID=UPI002B1CE62D|nr:gastrula zinc finger protein xFG20-1-like [Entelurus aequoreus]